MCLSRCSVGRGSCLGAEFERGMAHLYRLIFVVSLWLPSAASAVVPKVMEYGSTPTGPWLSTLSAACQAEISRMNADYKWTVSGTQPPNTCLYDGSFGGQPQKTTRNLYTRMVCPANSTGSSSCTCNSGFEEKDGQCVPPNRDDRCAGDFALAGFGLGSGKLADTQIMKGEIPSGDMCWPYDAPGSGCTVRFVQDKVVTMPDGSKQTYGRLGLYIGPAGTTQGKACDITDPGHEVSADCKTVGSIGNASGGRAVCADPPKCPGGFGGEVNGVEVCVKDDGANVTKSEKETVTKKPDGSTEKVTEKTTCQGKTCTTEKTTTNTPAGGGGSTTNVTNVNQPKEDYCKNNADAAQCGKGSKGDGDGDGKGGSFGGSCSAGFTCEGDALQCSMAQEQHKRACELMSNPSDESKLYDANKGKTGNQTRDLPGNEDVDLSGERIDTSSAIGGGSCMSDIQISLAGQTASLPLSDLCKWHEYMGDILVAIALLGALRIIAGG